MKHLRNLIIVLILSTVTLTTLGGNVQVVRAQTGDVSGNGGAVYCRNGARDYGNFLSAVISYNGFVEYWKDILVRYNANMCLYLDIDSLLTRIDKARQLIRNAFYNCDSNAQKLAKTYYQLDAELFFLRNYVDVSNGNILIKSEKGVTNDFISYYVNDKGFFTTDEAQTLLQQFISKYQARMDSYLNCQDPTWGNLIAKWNEFKSNLGGFTAVQESVEQINKSWDNAINTPFKRTGGLLGGLLDVKINDLDPATAWSDISTQLKNNSPSGFTFNQFQAAQTADAAYHDDVLSRTTYLGQYQQLYQNGTADITQAIIDRVNYLDNSIVGTYDYIDKTAQCTKGIVEKVC